MVFSHRLDPGRWGGVNANANANANVLRPTLARPLAFFIMGAIMMMMLLMTVTVNGLGMWMWMWMWM